MVVGGRELIDTLWNVNLTFGISSFFTKLRINRYIMECKSPFLICLQTQKQELIDTLWNVNDYEVFNLTKKEQELIDTLWNVNIFSRPCRF